MAMSITQRASARLPPPAARPPRIGLTAAEVASRHDEVVASHQAFAPLVRRADQRPWALTYLDGHRLPLERTSSAPMADALVGGTVQAMQPFISDGAWADEAVLQRHQEVVAETLGAPATGVLILDGCDFPKQGEHSVGVARPWGGAVGTGATGQASVVAGYASARGYPLVDRHLSRPAAWVTEGYPARRPICGVPAETPCRTRTEVAWAMIAGRHQRGVVSCQWGIGDEPVGTTPVRLDQSADAGLASLMEVPHHVRVWRERPLTAVPPPTGTNGHPVTRPRVAPAASPPLRVEALAAPLPPDAWPPALIQEGSTGPLVAAVAVVRVGAGRDRLPGPAVWLVLRRSVGEAPELNTYLGNAAAGTPRETFVWLLGRRWPIEQASKESTDELGLDHDEGRGWRGWHHQRTMTVLAHHFLRRLRCRLGGTAPALTVPQGRVRLAVTLPAQPRDAAAVLALVQEIQRRNYAAARSHRKRTLRRLQDSS
jgi:SRSO17 transposase